jgi:hypothetical protein
MCALTNEPEVWIRIKVFVDATGSRMIVAALLRLIHRKFVRDQNRSQLGSSYIREQLLGLDQDRLYYQVGASCGSTLVISQLIIRPWVCDPQSQLFSFGICSVRSANDT